MDKPTVTVRRVRPGELSSGLKEDLAKILVQVDDEFEPPLSARSGTTQAGLKDLEPVEGGGYLDEMLEQDFILAFRGDSLAGFLSFRTPHVDTRFPEVCPCIYVSTIAVGHDHRRAGVARALYAALFALPPTLPKWIVLRTWTTNEGHLGLLAELGFESVHTIPDDRAKGVGTVYLAADRSRSKTDVGRAGRLKRWLGFPAAPLPAPAAAALTPLVRGHQDR